MGGPCVNTGPASFGPPRMHRRCNNTVTKPGHCSGSVGSAGGRANSNIKLRALTLLQFSSMYLARYIADRICRTGRRAAQQLKTLLAGVAIGLAAHTAAANPPLPTPCIAGNCGPTVPLFVQTGNVSAVAAGNVLTVNQATSKAILNWANFNIANGYSVQFLQPSATAAVLNKIWSADPSVIAGQLSATGQVYLYNQNGIVFDKGAQVDVGGLVASTLPLKSDDLFLRGILSDNADRQAPPAAFVAPATGTAAQVLVNAGATLTTSDGGRIMLLGSAVTNKGTLSTPDGQTILGAATNNVYLAASSNADMRGLLIAVDGGGTTGTVINQGQITAERGNITLAGLMVNQQGLLSATTSVGSNGSIYLIAGDVTPSQSYVVNSARPSAFGGLAPNNGGTLLLAPGSVTEILPDGTDTATLTASQLRAFIPSEVDLAGRQVALEGNATVQVPSGKVNVYATDNLQSLLRSPSQPVVDDSSVYLDRGSVIDVSGLLNVAAPVTQNILQVTLETIDLQNDPLLRAGFLHGAKVTVDVNHPPALFDVTPYVNNIGSSIAQRSTQAGSIKLTATGEVIARAGSTLNVSGGSIAYQGGYGPSTTKLLGADGKVYDIATAPNNMQYVGIANGYGYVDQTWGTSTQGGEQSYYAGYIKGMNAGSLEIDAPQAYLRGDLLAATIAGIYQRSPQSLAAGGNLILGCASCVNASRFADYGLDGGVSFADNPGDTLVADVLDGGYPVAASNLPNDNLISPAQLSANGFTSLSVFSNGAITLPRTQVINLASNGALTLKSGTGMDIAGRISAPGGSIVLQTVNTGDLMKHSIDLGPGAVVDVSGNWTNDSPQFAAQPGTGPAIIDGGKVTVSAAGDVVLGSGSLINVSGGGWVSQSDRISQGNAGSISVAASFNVAPGFAPFTGLVQMAPDSRLLGASLNSGGGGTLALQSGSVTVGASSGAAGELVLAPSFFAEGGFSAYRITGQNSVVIGNPGDSTGAAPVVVAPLQQTLAYTANALLQATGSSLLSFTELRSLPAALRSPASVSFVANASSFQPGVVTGEVTLARDASIITDPLAAVTLAANGYNGNVLVFGRILAPAGNIKLQLEDPAATLYGGFDPGFIANQRIELGPDAVLSAAGYANINTLNQLGLREGKVLSGGTVSLLANKGFVQTDPGSLVSVDGVGAVLDLVGPTGVNATVVAGNAGAVTIDAREGIVLQGDLRGNAATLDGAAIAGAGGGSLSIGLGNGFSNAGLNGVTAQNSSSGIAYPADNRVVMLAGTTPDGPPAGGPGNVLQSGVAVLDVARLSGGGFDALAIRSADTIEFAGAVSLRAGASLTLDAPLFQGQAGSHTQLTAPYVALGNYFNNVDYFLPGSASPNAAAVLQPVGGTGGIAVNAQLIDLRGISGWSGFASENLDSLGDIRFVSPLNAFNAPPALGVTGYQAFEGALDTSAALELRAAQLYPTTATGFAINDLSSAGAGLSAVPTVVNITATAGTSPPPVPLSAAGSLAINATQINQAGVLRAPFGAIALNGISLLDSTGAVLAPGTVLLADGSITSVSASGALIPYGSTANGVQWTYSPLPGLTNVLAQPPAKKISLTGADVKTAAGAKVDLSGGGDLYAYEFIAGQGGSTDVLDPGNLPASAHPVGTNVYSYAILPTLGSTFAPIDPQYAQGSPATGNQTIYLSGVPGLAAGIYALLPARYALLPGAYAIQVVGPDSGIAAGSAVRQPDGSYVTGARFGIAGTNVLGSLSSSVRVSPTSVVHTQSQYAESYANLFFSQQAAASKSAAPQLPADAGELLLSVTNSLNLLGPIGFGVGQFVSGKDATGNPIMQQGQGGDVAITGRNLVVVDSLAGQPASAPGTVDLDVQQLDNLGAQTLILGASSANTAAGQLLDLGATETVELQNHTALSAPQVVLAALDSVTVDSNAQLIAQGTSNASTSAPGHWLLPGGGALLRVSSGSAVSLGLDPGTLPQSPTGIVNIDAGATVESSGSLLLYGSDNTLITPGARISAPAVSLYSRNVSLGDVPAGSPGLVLTSDMLGSLAGLTDLTIGSGSAINFYGAVQLGAGGTGLNSVTFDTPALLGFGSGDKLVRAGAIKLVNSTNVQAVPSASAGGSGALDLVAAGAAATPGQITLGGGSKSVSGFGVLNLRADGDIVGQDTGTLSIAAAAPVDVSITSTALMGLAGSSQSLTTTGTVTMNSTGTAPPRVAPAPGLGAAFAIEGSAIVQDGVIALPSGTLSLHAKGGDVVLGARSRTLANGVAKSFQVSDAVAPGGRIRLSADNGNVVVADGASLDVSGANSASGVAGDAGTLSISAPRGAFVYAGSGIQGAASNGQASGSFALDVGSGLGGQGLSALDAMLAAGGFHGDLALRTRNDATVTLGDALRVASYELAADGGSIDVASSAAIDASGTAMRINGGDISVWAGAGLTIEPGASFRSNAGAPGPIGANGQALAARGGNVTLGSAVGSVQLSGGTAQNPTSFAMRGTEAGSDGTLTIRAPRLADESNVSIAVQSPSGVRIDSSRATVIEGFQRYSAAALGSADAACGAGGSCDIVDTSGILFGDAANFMGHAPSIAAQLGLGNVVVRPGIEIASASDLTVGDGSSAAWDLASWGAALGAPVNLTLRAAGNLVVATSVSDGFTDNGRVFGLWPLGEPPGLGVDSGSYRFAAGADLAAASPYSTVTQLTTVESFAAPPNTGNLILTPGTTIRTGTGAIDLSAGGDVLLGYAFGGYDANLNLLVSESDPLSSAVYTAGTQRALAATQATLFTAPNLARRGGGVAGYPTGGGNVRVVAADDIRSAPSAQLVTDWLWRRGPLDGTNSPRTNTSWWVMFNRFQEGVGALGGGSLSLVAGRDILNTSAVIPTTGRLLTASGAAPVPADLLLSGGGQLDVNAGGDIISGVFENDWGNSGLSAGGAITSGSHSTFAQEFPNVPSVGSRPAADIEIYPLVIVGNGSFDINARAGVELAGVGNSTTLPITTGNVLLTQSTSTDAAFFAYARTDQPGALNVASSGGDVTLNTQAFETIPIVALGDGNVYDGSGSPNNYLSVYPSNLSVSALSGDINLGSARLSGIVANGLNIGLYPAARGNLRLVAAGSINNDGIRPSIVMSEADPTRVPSPFGPAGGTQFTGVSGVDLPLSPLHLPDDANVLLVADAGDIAPLLLTAPKPATLIAGGNISELNFSGKNLRPGDVTMISAGGDITYATPTAPITNELLQNAVGINLSGPGQLEVLAGGSIGLGDSTGVLTIGNLADPRLAPVGASLLVGAGLGSDQGRLRAPAYQSFVSTFLDPDKLSGKPSDYAALLTDYMRRLDPAANATLTYAAALQAFKALPPAKQLPLLARVLSAELSATGLAHSQQGTTYDRGYAAIDALFPSRDASGQAIARSGDINMFFSQLKTEQGGDIDLLVPGGSVVVGVPNPPASLSAVKSFTTNTGLTVPAEVNLGILVLGSGAVRGFVDQNFEVNQSRILTLEGGDIILWASNGNIDAGRGAKSASGAPPPVIQSDPNGNLFVDPSNAVSGSGIGQLLTTPGLRPGLVNLIAPKGAVDAGDAGIRVAGNLNIAALQVIGAANITVVGTSSGVPVSDAGALSGALSGANSLGDASKNAVDQLGQDLGNAGNLQQLSDELAPIFINVKMFCLGVQCETN
jgi:filamentous hemagglutinin